MISIFEVSETNKMISEEKLDVRTITLGLSLWDCVSDSLSVFNGNIYRKITHAAGDLVRVGEDISRDYGIPIVHKRVSVTPLSLVSSACCRTREDILSVAETLDRAAMDTGVNFLGGFSVLCQKQMTSYEKLFIETIPAALSQTERVCASVNLASSKTGINMDAVRLMGDVVRETAILTAERDSIGCAKLVIFANAPDDNPFMAGAFHGVSEGDSAVNVGVSGPGVVRAALSDCRGADFETLSETIKKTAFKITRVGQLVALEASERLGVPFGIIDLSLAPTPQVGDSIADILYEMGIEYPGAPGTTAALALLNDQIKKGGVMASSSVGGLSGAFIPVSEDRKMAEAARIGALSVEKLEAMTSVCSVGLDMIAIPGDTSSSAIAGIIADEAAIGIVNNKTTAVRLIPVIGKDVGDEISLGGLMGSAPVMKVSEYSSAGFVDRSGRIPAPIHSFKN